MPNIDPAVWVSRCADRLREQWKRAPRAELEQAALDLVGQPRWREMEPEAAAAEWLRQGVAAEA